MMEKVFKFLYIYSTDELMYVCAVQSFDVIVATIFANVCYRHVFHPFFSQVFVNIYVVLACMCIFILYMYAIHLLGKTSGKYITTVMQNYCTYSTVQYVIRNSLKRFSYRNLSVHSATNEVTKFRRNFFFQEKKNRNTVLQMDS